MRKLKMAEHPVTAFQSGQGKVNLAVWTLAALIIILMVAPSAVGQLPDTTAGQRPVPETGSEAPTTMLPHFPDGRFWISGQVNVIYQAHPPFDAKYSGPHSFQSHFQDATGQVTTLYTGMQLTKSAEVLLDFEAAAGLGLSGALGIAGFTNLDAVRDATLSDAPYLSRVMYHQVISLGHGKTEANRGPLATFSQLPSRRLELRIGKFGITDFFDTNSVGGDSHLQFLNWWVSDNKTGVSTLYNGAGAKNPLIVTIPANPNNQNSKVGSPTGIISNTNPTDFVLSNGLAATFIFATIDGSIAAWNPTIHLAPGTAAPSTHAITIAAAKDGSGYTGLT